MKHLNNHPINENIFKKKTVIEKLDKLFIKLDTSYEKLVDEAGSVDNLSSGMELGYDNFGKFVNTSYNIIDIIKNEVEENSTNLKNYLLKLKEKTDTINYISRVSELSVEKFKFIKRNIEKILSFFG